MRRREFARRRLFALSRVWGVYSEWSPSIWTDRIKVLTADRTEQEVEIPSECKIDPHRIGKVGEADFNLQRRFEKPKPYTSEEVEDDDLDSS